MTEAAVIKYCRMFSTDQSAVIGSSLVSHLDAESQCSHLRIRELRSKYVAHAINVFDDVFVTTGVRDGGGVRYPASSVGMGYERVCLGAGAAANLLLLLKEMLKVIKKKIDSEESLFLKEIQGWSLDKLHEFDLHEPMKLSDASVAKVRSHSVSARRRSVKSKRGASR